MAFVVVQHLSPDFKSLMDELLARHTKLPIHRVEDGMKVEPGNVYLLPPKKDMIISNGKLLLSERDTTQQLSLPIDHFFRSLAQDLPSLGIGIILSGTGSDGSRGVRRIHEAGGLVISQSEDSARFDGMPRAAIDTGCVDVVVEAEQIGDILVQYAHEPFRDQLANAIKEANRSESAIGSLFQALQKEYGLDFRHYKSTTITRRIQRRISITRTSSVAEYAELVENDKDELRLLYADLLIGVTRFFRDEVAFEALDRELTQKLSKDWRGEQIRVWVCACATGEEAYSIAILLHERLTGMNRNPDIKIFATDIDRTSLEVASHGVYPTTSIGQMSDARRDRYFREVDGGYQVVPEIRQSVVFAPHNILRDAPFTNLHLVTCRNLLIYLNAEAQKKALSLFHFGLRSQGLLFLGSSETVGDLSDELDALDKEARLFTKLRDIRLPGGLRDIFAPDGGGGTSPGSRGLVPPAASGTSSELLSAYDQLLAEFMPSSILVNEQGAVVETFGDASKYLRVRPGRLSTAVLDMVDGDLRIAVSGGIQRVRSKGNPVTFNAVRVSVDGQPARVRLSVMPQVQKSGREFLLLAFYEEQVEEAVKESGDAPRVAGTAVDSERVRQLEVELQVTKENLQATVEELETSNEELQATNEELVASNEELQSTNEELHSVNEELYTVNAEHQRKIAELTELTADMDNLLASTEIHAVFLDDALRIRRFTPKAVELFSFVAADLGRHFSSFTNQLDHPDVESDMVDVLEQGEPIDRNVHDNRGRNFLLRILPYRTGGRVGGIVVTLVDITALTAQQKQLNRLRIEQQAILDTVGEGIFGLAADGTIQSFNPAAEEIFRVDADQLLNVPFLSLVSEEFAEGNSQLLHAVRDAIDSGCSVSADDVLMVRPNGETFSAELTCSGIDAANDVDIALDRVLVVRDVSDRIRSRRELQERERELRLVTDSVPALISYVDRDLRYQYVNKQYSQLWGRPREDFDNLSVQDLIGEDASRKAEAHWKRALDGETVEYSMLVDVADQCFWANVTYTPNIVDGEVDGFFATVVNTTELKQVEQGLQRALVSSGDAIYDWPIDGGEFFASDRLWSILERDAPSDEISFEDYLDLIHPDDMARVRVAIDFMLAGNSDRYRSEYRVRTGTDAYKWVLATGDISLDVTGKRKHLTGAIRDIQLQKKLEESLRQQVAQRDRFLAMLSHELRNPLGAVVNASMLLSQPNLTRGQSDVAVVTIAREAKQMAGLLDDLLEVSRVTTDKLSIEWRPVEYQAIIKEAVEAISWAAEVKSQSLSVDLPAEPVNGVADGSRIRQCISNLVSNAIKYTPANGQIQVSLSTRDDHAVISVRDDGVGMTPELMESVFSLFVQADETLAHADGGMGVGLALVRAIAELHGGDVHAESDGRDRGSLFELSIPLQQAAPDDIDLAEAPLSTPSEENGCPVEVSNEAAKDRLRVLVIDDLEGGRTTLAMWLEATGHVALTAESGATGLAAIEEHKPDVLLVDIGLPDLNGFEIAKRVRAMSDFQPRLVAAVTGYGTEADRAASAAAGFDVHLAKPIDLGRLATLLKQASQEPS